MVDFLYEGKKILIVEDQVIIAMNEMEELKSVGFNPLYATSGEGAIKIVEEKNGNFDLILMDIDLGHNKINGADTAKKILKKYDIPIVFVSSHTEKEIIDETEKITAYGYIYKNIENSLKLASIKMALRLSESTLKIKRSEEKFMTAFMLNPATVSINDMETNQIVDCNLAFEKITGYTKEEAVGKTAAELNFFEDIEELGRMLKVIEEQGELTNFKHIFKNRRGESFLTYLSTKKIWLNNRQYHMVCQTEFESL